MKITAWILFGLARKSRRAYCMARHENHGVHIVWRCMKNHYVHIVLRGMKNHDVHIVWRGMKRFLFMSSLHCYVAVINYLDEVTRDDV